MENSSFSSLDIRLLAEKYGMVYEYNVDDNISSITIPETIPVYDDDRTFAICRWNKNNYECITQFQLIFSTDESFTNSIKTTTIEDVETFEEIEANIKNFKSFLEMFGSLRKVYNEKIKLNKMETDF